MAGGCASPPPARGPPPVPAPAVTAGYRRVLVLGGARSGKSRFAEQMAAACGEPVLYVAAATADDPEMAERIRRHQQQRPPSWRTLEVPLRPADRLARALGAARTVLLEDLTLLLSNTLLAGQGAVGDQPGALAADAAERAEAEVRDQLDRLLQLPAHLVVVSNEVGLGLVPPFPLGRVFRDALGRVNQHAAMVCEEVFLLVAGLPLRLKPASVR